MTDQEAVERAVAAAVEQGLEPYVTDEATLAKAAVIFTVPNE
jgi:hypothetical protein